MGDKAKEGLEAAKKAAEHAKQLAIQGGAPEEKFLLIPDEIGVKSSQFGVAYYFGMASLSVVTFGLFAVAVRKISLNSRARDTRVLAGESQEEVPFEDEMGPCE